jgi:hypothetical protein
MTISARSLFRATGNSRKARPMQLEDGSIIQSATVERAKDDFVPTPPEPTRALLHYEGDRIRELGLIWEPAAGDGAMMREIEGVGFPCVGSDLVDRGCGARIRSFYDFDQPLGDARAIITNPPYIECNERDGQGRWIWHAMDVLKIEYMALLLSWSWPGAGGHAKIWATYPPARVYLMRWKIDFTGEGAPPMLNGWFVWDRTWKGEPVLRMMDRVDTRQGNLL